MQFLKNNYEKVLLAVVIILALVSWLFCPFSSLTGQKRNWTIC